MNITDFWQLIQSRSPKTKWWWQMWCVQWKIQSQYFNAFTAIDSNGDTHPCIGWNNVFCFRYASFAFDTWGYPQWMCAFSAVAAAVYLCIGHVLCMGMPIEIHRNVSHRTAWISKTFAYTNWHFFSCLVEIYDERTHDRDRTKGGITKKNNTPNEWIPTKSSSVFFVHSHVHNTHIHRASFFDHRYTGSEATKQ